MGNFAFPSAVGYTHVLEVSFTLFPWSETLWSTLAVSSRPPGNTRVACVPLAGTLKVIVGEQAAGPPRVTSPWGLSAFQPPHCQPRAASHPALGRRTHNHCLLPFRGARVQGDQRSCLTWFSSEQSIGGLAAFRAFLKSEYSEENIEFWVSCEEYKKTKSPAKLSPKARKIYDEFISVQATKEVRALNIPWAKAPP